MAQCLVVMVNTGTVVIIGTVFWRPWSTLAQWTSLAQCFGCHGQQHSGHHWHSDLVVMDNMPSQHPCNVNYLMIFKVYLGVIANILIPHIFMSLKKGEQPHIWKALPHLNSDKCALCDVDRSHCMVLLGWIGTCGHHCLMTPMCVIIAELSAATNLTWVSSWSILLSHLQTRI